MRELIKDEISSVSGGEIICTFGLTDISCTGTLTAWLELAGQAYDDTVGSFADIMMWIDEQFPDDRPEEEPISDNP
jgi:hypothetical protein